MECLLICHITLERVQSGLKFDVTAIVLYIISARLTMLEHAIANGYLSVRLSVTLIGYKYYFG